MATLTIPTPVETLTPDELHRMNAYWRACNYLSGGMIFLRDNPLLREPLKPEHIKNRLLGHWGSDPGQSFIWVHLNRLIKKYSFDVIYISGPGHGAPATLANSLPRMCVMVRLSFRFLREIIRRRRCGARARQPPGPVRFAHRK